MLTKHTLFILQMVSCPASQEYENVNYCKDCQHCRDYDDEDIVIHCAYESRKAEKIEPREALERIVE